MAKLANNDFTINPEKNDGQIQIRMDACKCGKTKCDYTATVSAAVTKIETGAPYENDELALGAASYPVSTIGANALAADIKKVLDGLCDSVSVIYTDAVTDTLEVTVTGSLIVLSKLNATSFSVSNCKGTGE